MEVSVHHFNLHMAPAWLVDRRYSNPPVPPPPTNWPTDISGLYERIVNVSSYLPNNLHNQRVIDPVFLPSIIIDNNTYNQHFAIQGDVKEGSSGGAILIAKENQNSELKKHWAGVISETVSQSKDRA
jgi:hypothetical protein